MRPRRPQASRRVSRFVAPATPRSTRDPSVAQASDDGLEVVGGSPKTVAGDRFPPRVVVLPPFLHVTALALQDPSASMSNMKSMATRHRTSKPRLPPVAGVPAVSSVQWFNVTITSTDTRPADGSASRPAQYSRHAMQPLVQQYIAISCCIGQYSGHALSRAHCMAIQQYSPYSHTAIHHHTVYNAIQSTSVFVSLVGCVVEGHAMYVRSVDCRERCACSAKYVMLCYVM